MNTAADPVRALADYMTGKEVGNQSIALSLPPGSIWQLKERAQAFFALRGIWGISGHMTSDQAVEAINNTLKGKQ